MSLKELVKSGPRNIRRRLFRDVFVIILATVCSISILALLQGISTKDKVSARLISETSQLVQKRFVDFLAPFDANLQVLSRMGELSGFDISNFEVLEKIFVPVLDVYPDIKHVSVIDQTGAYFKLLRSDTGYESVIKKKGKNLSILSTHAYRGAIAAPKNSPVFWSESFTSNRDESGLSASIKTDLPQLGKTVVVVFFIPAKELLSFISDIEVPENVDIILHNNHGIFLSSKQLFYYNNPEKSDLKPPDSSPESLEILKAAELWTENEDTNKSVRKFKAGGVTWWTGSTPLSDKNTQSWISIIVPETDIVDNVYQQWLKLGIFIAGILVIAFIMTVNLVRRYSFQLKDLPHHDMVRSDLVESVRKFIDAGESTTLEFKSTMRKNLQTGKNGKEIEIAWLKTITAFMNSDGGILLIGVNDDGLIIGTEDDEFTNEDKTRLHFKNLINTHIGTAFSRYIHLKFCDMGDKTVLLIECERVRKPVFLTLGKTEDFYIRSGPSSMKLSMSQMITYLAER